MKKQILVLFQILILISHSFCEKNSSSIKSLQWQDENGNVVKKGEVEKPLQLVVKTKNMENEEIIFSVIDSHSRKIVYSKKEKVVNNEAKIEWTYHIPEEELFKMPNFYFKVSDSRNKIKKSRKIQISQTVRLVITNGVYEYVKVDGILQNGEKSIFIQAERGIINQENLIPGKWVFKLRGIYSCYQDDDGFEEDADKVIIYNLDLLKREEIICIPGQLIQIILEGTISLS